MNFSAILQGAAADPDAPAPEAPPVRPVAERLEEHARYVSLVAEQLRALEAGDVGRLRELLEERAALETALGGEGEALLGEALASLNERVERDQELRGHWRALREDALRATRALAGLRPRRGRYLRQDDSSPATVDVRF